MSSIDAQQGNMNAQKLALQQSLRVLGSFLQFALIGIFLDWMLFAGTSVNLPLQFFLIMLLLLAAWKWNGLVILLAIQVSLFFREAGRSSMIPGWGALLYATLALMLIAYACWSRTITARLSDWFADRMMGVIDSTVRTPVANESSTSAAWQFTVQQTWLLGCVIVTIFFMIWLPVTANIRDLWLDQARANDFVLWPGATMVAAAIALIVVVREFAWRQMSKLQASIYLKSLFVNDHFRDLRMIVLRRLKLRRKRKITETK